ncbi:MAG: hypothetical protein ACRD8O_12380 [Bryobacteraceae bacterium]
MPNYAELEETLSERLSLRRRPVAVSYLDSPPASVARFEGTMPSGCSFWRVAAAGRVFYTVPEDHFNCPVVGSFKHSIDLPPERAAELEQTLGLKSSACFGCLSRRRLWFTLRSRMRQSSRQWRSWPESPDW